MKTSNKGIELIKNFESFRSQTYLCAAGVLTIGYGHTGPEVIEGKRITIPQADELLKHDLSDAEKAVNKLSGLNQNQFDALVSFTFNIGTGNFLSSTLYKKAKANPADPTIRDEFNKWVYAKKQKLAGLINRRKRESELYFS